MFLQFARSHEPISCRASAKGVRACDSRGPRKCHDIDRHPFGPISRVPLGMGETHRRTVMSGFNFLLEANKELKGGSLSLWERRAHESDGTLRAIALAENPTLPGFVLFTRRAACRSLTLYDPNHTDQPDQSVKLIFAQP